MRSSPFCTRASEPSFCERLGRHVRVGGRFLSNRCCVWQPSVRGYDNAARAGPVCCAVCDDLWGRADVSAPEYNMEYSCRAYCVWHRCGSRTCCLWYLAKTTTGAERGEMIELVCCRNAGHGVCPAAALSGVFPTPKEGSMLSVNAYNARLCRHCSCILWPCILCSVGCMILQNMRLRSCNPFGREFAKAKNPKEILLQTCITQARHVGVTFS